MAGYIDGFAFPIKQIHAEEYQAVAEQIAVIWKEYGALSYQEFIGDDLSFEGTQSFVKSVNAAEDECIVFGWLSFTSKESRDLAHKQVAADLRMQKLVEPLMQESNPIFNPVRMIFGGFKSFVKN